MALDSYSGLKTALATWIDRAGDAVYTANIADIVTLAESKLNRLLGIVETDAALIGVVNSNQIDISALSLVAPVALLASYDGVRETRLTPKSDGTYEELTVAGRARYWSVDGTAIVFERPLDGAYNFRFRYDQKFALSDVSPSNWLLANYPDVYLAACLAWSGAFSEDWVNAGSWKSVLDEAIPEVQHVISRNRRADLTVDPALQAIGKRWRGNGQWLVNLVS